jgi:hypothetical protein
MAIVMKIEKKPARNNRDCMRVSPNLRLFFNPEALVGYMRRSSIPFCVSSIPDPFRDDILPSQSEGRISIRIVVILN